MIAVDILREQNMQVRALPTELPVSLIYVNIISSKYLIGKRYYVLILSELSCRHIYT